MGGEVVVECYYGAVLKSVIYSRCSSVIIICIIHQSHSHTNNHQYYLPAFLTLKRPRLGTHAVQSLDEV
jgi:hypothetical protein